MLTEKFYELKDLCALLTVTDLRTVTKWCKEKNIIIERIGSKKVVNRFLVDIELDKPLLEGLKKKYPDRWEQLYECYLDKDRLGYLLLIDEHSTLDFRPTTSRIRAKSDIAAKLLK